MINFLNLNQRLKAILKYNFVHNSKHTKWPCYDFWHKCNEELEKDTSSFLKYILYISPRCVVVVHGVTGQDIQPN